MLDREEKSAIREVFIKVTSIPFLFIMVTSCLRRTLSQEAENSVVKLWTILELGMKAYPWSFAVCQRHDSFLLSKKIQGISSSKYYSDLWRCLKSWYKPREIKIGYLFDCFAFGRKVVEDPPHIWSCLSMKLENHSWCHFGNLLLKK